MHVHGEHAEARNFPITNFDVLLTLHLSIFISLFNQLDAQNFCFTISFISCLYMFRAHVLIIRRSQLHYTASGTNHTYRWPSGALDPVRALHAHISIVYTQPI